MTRQQKTSNQSMKRTAVHSLRLSAGVVHIFLWLLFGDQKRHDVIKRRGKKETKGMKILTTVIAITLTAFAVKASEEIPYIAMPVGTGYAVDAKGARHPNAFCMHDAVFAPHPQYPLHSKSWESRSSDPGTWTRNIQGNGLYRLDVDLNTGKVNQVTIIKSTGSAILDTASISVFKRWIFRPGKWKEITIPTAVRTKWIGTRAIAH